MKIKRNNFFIITTPSKEILKNKGKEKREKREVFKVVCCCLYSTWRNNDNYTNSAQRLLYSAFGCWLCCKVSRFEKYNTIWLRIKTQRMNIIQNELHHYVNYPEKWENYNTIYNTYTHTLVCGIYSVFHVALNF